MLEPPALQIGGSCCKVDCSSFLAAIPRENKVAFLRSTAGMAIQDYWTEHISSLRGKSFTGIVEANDRRREAYTIRVGW